jgi:hypothetical protein
MDYPLYNPELFCQESLRERKFTCLTSAADSFEHCVETIRPSRFPNRLSPTIALHGLPLQQQQLLLTVCAEELRKKALQYVNSADEGGCPARTAGDLLFDAFHNADDQNPVPGGKMLALIRNLQHDSPGIPRRRGEDGDILVSERLLLEFSVLLPIILNNFQPNELDSLFHELRNGEYFRTKSDSKVRAIVLRDCVSVGRNVLAVPSDISMLDCNLATYRYALPYFSAMVCDRTREHHIPRHALSIPSTRAVFLLLRHLSSISQMHAIACSSNPSHISETFVKWFTEYVVYRCCVPPREEIDEKLAQVMRDVSPRLSVRAEDVAFFDRMHPENPDPIRAHRFVGRGGGWVGGLDHMQFDDGLFGRGGARGRGGTGRGGAARGGAMPARGERAAGGNQRMAGPAANRMEPDR